MLTHRDIDYLSKTYDDNGNMVYAPPPKRAESTQHSVQHRQPKICPKCGGHGVRDRIGISGTRRCHTCNGTGKLRASA